VIRTDDPALEQTPESLDGVCVSSADNVLASAVPNHVVIHVSAQEPVFAVLVGRNEFHIFGNGLADKLVQCRGVGILNHFRNDHSWS